ncbi:helix-turn-helix domain-containing protein [Cohnella mopanensis]|uniref:helix-turn-helix domain-containing protein n=1 Tax=Cohnella mopanensis TaxID=2911966 RepID=UPI0034E1CCC1
MRARAGRKSLKKVIRTKNIGLWNTIDHSAHESNGIKLQRNKLLEAARFIRECEHPDWADMAYDLGYSSQQHFITDFNRVLGKTPLQYKKELGFQSSE